MMSDNPLGELHSDDLPDCEHNARIAEENRRYDEEQERIKRERWEVIEATLREMYPSRIPKSWTNITGRP